MRIVGEARVRVSVLSRRFLAAFDETPRRKSRERSRGRSRLFQSAIFVAKQGSTLVLLGKRSRIARGKENGCSPSYEDITRNQKDDNCLS
jgi:hypothetical protein